MAVPTEETTLFSLFSETGVTLADNFNAWRKKTNGIVNEVLAVNGLHTNLVNALYDAGVPKYVTLDTNQSLTGTKTFGAGSAAIPRLKVGAAGLWHDATDSSLNSTQQFKCSKLWSTGTGLNLRGINYTTPASTATHARSFMMSDTSSQMSWLGITSLVDSDGTLSVNGSANTFRVGVIGTSNLGTGVVTGTKVATGAIDDTKLADNSVINAKVVDGAITNSKLANNSVDANKLQDNAVTTPKVVDKAINNAKLGGIDLAVQTTQFVTETTEVIAGHATSWFDTEITHSITVRPGSKVRVQVTVNAATANGSGGFGQGALFRLKRGASTVIGVPTEAGSRRAAATFVSVANNSQVGVGYIDFIDAGAAPAGGLVTYTLQTTTAAGYDVFINRTSADTNSASFFRTVSSITLTEYTG